MISALNIDKIISLVKSAPEQTAFDWKSDFVQPKDDDYLISLTADSRLAKAALEEDLRVWNCIEEDSENINQKG